jgi:hypothetical protein
MMRTRPSVRRPIRSLVMWLDQLWINDTAISSANSSSTRTSARLSKNTVRMPSKRFSRWYLASDSASWPNQVWTEHCASWTVLGPKSNPATKLCKEWVIFQ